MRPERQDEDELLGCTAPSHLPKSPIRLIRLCSRPTWFLGFLGQLLHFAVLFRPSGEIIGLCHSFFTLVSVIILLYPLPSSTFVFCLLYQHVCPLVDNPPPSLFIFIKPLLCNFSLSRSSHSCSFIKWYTSVF